MVQVFLDLDNVLVDFVNGACRLHNVTNPYRYERNYGYYEMMELVHVPPSEFWTVMGYDFWANLDWMPDGLLLIDVLLKYVNEKQVTILTSPISTHGCIDGKMDWIRRNIPMWKRRFFVGPPKEAIAGPNKLLIDDHDKNVDKWVQHGGAAIQVPRLTNRLHSRSINAVDYVDQQLAHYFKGIK